MSQSLSGHVKTFLKALCVQGVKQSEILCAIGQHATLQAWPSLEGCAETRLFAHLMSLMSSEKHIKM